MKLASLLDSLLNRSRLSWKTGLAILALVVVIDAIPLVVDKSKAHSNLESLPGFWPFYGFAGCFLLVYVAKSLGALGLLQKETENHE